MSDSAATAADARKKVRAWCFTENNPTRKILFPDGLPDGIKYIIYQLERGEQGTPHLQGYIQLSRPQAMSWLKKITSKTAEGEVFHVFERAHFIVAKGNAEQNKQYCTKAEGRLEGPWTLGEASKQGDRSDLKEAAEQLMRTGDIRAIDPGVFLKYASGCLKLAALAPPPRRDSLKVITIVGPTGIGKSYAVHDLVPDVYVVNMGNSGLWWDGYTGQPAVMFEEFKGQVQLQKMLQILDPYPLRLEIKGGLVPARFTMVFITSNYTPDKWYKNEEGARDEEMKALARRLDIGDPTRIPPRPDGPRYIHVDSRDALHRSLDMLKWSGILPGAAAAAAPPRSPPTDEECAAAATEEPPRLRRAVAHITVADAPQDADMVTTADGEHFVRDDLIAQHSPSWFAPQP
ncbi:Rep [uncultured virus]|uniref:ATP-dependent helicase Rep n=1 Tax=uncultured virus TaxID=340016 RepID=A0A2K9LRX6_9VIRU|nr:Rep [uncultured virus]